MSKFNKLKLVIFLKSFQIFLYILIFSLLLTLFIASVNIAGEKIFIWNNPMNINDIIIGFYKISLIDNHFVCNISPLFIVCNVIIIIGIILFLFNLFVLRIKFSFERNQFFKSGLCFIIISLLLLIIIYAVYFSKNFYFIPNTENKELNLNSLVNYTSTTHGNLTIANYWFSVGGIIYLSLLSPIFAVLVFFPIKIIYNLVRVSYI